MIPVSAVALGAEEEALVLEVLRSGQLAQGPMVARLEAAFRELTGTGHAVAVSSGTTALVAALESLALEPGSEVITTPFTFAATLNAILEAGLTARFVDIGPDFNLDADAVAAAVNARTRVLLPVHLYGLPADMRTLVKVAEAHDLDIVEDAAQAHGARVADRPVGGFGLACFSLYATKNVTSGEGGVVTTDDDDRAERLRMLRNQGMRARYEYVIPGHNYRLTDLQAAVALPQLERLPARTEARRANAARLSAGLDGVPGLVLPEEVPGREHVWHQYTVRVVDGAAVTRDEAVAALAAEGVGAGVYYPRPVWDHDCYRHHPGVVLDPTTRAEAVARQVLSLPVHPQLTHDDVDAVVHAVRKVFGA